MSNDEDFASLLAAHGAIDHVRLSVGDKVRARVIHIGRDSVFCELSLSQEGALPIEDVIDAEGNLTVALGDSIDVFVVRLGDSIELGRRLGKGAVDQETLEAARDGGVPLDGTVTGVNKGGLEVSVAGTRGFCPIGQADIEYVEDPASFVGKSLQFIVREVKDNGRNVILSRRVLLERQREEKAAVVLAELQEGQRRTGKVSRIADFGVFVDIGGVDGLVPLSELGHKRVGSASEVVAVGDTVEVEVLRIEDDPKRKGRRRIALSMKATLPDPFVTAAAMLSQGQDIEGTVARLEAFGAFVEIGSGVQGLIDISQLAPRRVNHPREVVSVGDRVQIRVLGIDTDQRRISLSLKEAGAVAREPGAALQVGDDVRGTVERVERYGVFLDLGGGRRALLPAAETGTQRGTDLGRVFPVGTELAVQVIGIDGDERIKVSKTARELAEERAEAETYARDPAADPGRGLGTLGDLLAAKAKKR